MKIQKNINDFWKIILLGLIIGGSIQGILVLDSASKRRAHVKEILEGKTYPGSKVKIKTSTMFTYFLKEDNYQLSDDLKEYVKKNMGKKRYQELISGNKNRPEGFKDFFKNRIKRVYTKISEYYENQKIIDLQQSFLAYPLSFGSLLFILFCTHLVKIFKLSLEEKRHDLNLDILAKEKEITKKEKVKNDIKNAINMCEDTPDEIQKKLEQINYLIEETGKKSLHPIQMRLKEKFNKALEKLKKEDKEWQDFTESFIYLTQRTPKEVETKIQLIMKDLDKYEHIKAKIIDYTKELEELVKRLSIEKAQQIKIQENEKQLKSEIDFDPF